MENVVKRIDFALYFYLNYCFVSKNHPEERASHDIHVKHKKTYEVLFPDHLSRVVDMEGDMNQANFGKFSRNQQTLTSPISNTGKLKNEKFKFPVIMSEALIGGFKKTNEELAQLDDNDVILSLRGFSGILNLWHSLDLNERSI